MNECEDSNGVHSLHWWHGNSHSGPMFGLLCGDECVGVWWWVAAPTCFFVNLLVCGGTRQILLVVFVFVCGGKKALDQVKWVAGSRSNSGGISLASGFGSTG